MTMPNDPQQPGGQQPGGQQPGGQQSYPNTGANQILSTPMRRDMQNKMISGVCAGMAKHLGMDVTVMRVVWALLSVVFSGLPIIVYVAFIFIMPEE